MADDDGKDVGGKKSEGSEGGHHGHKHAAHGAAHKSHLREKAHAGAVRRHVHAGEGVESGTIPFPTDKLLIALLAVSLLLNFYLFYQNSILQGGTAVTPKGVTETAEQATETTLKAAANKNAVKLDFYVMSQCPYGVQVLDAIAPVLKKMGDNVDFSVNFIANEGAGKKFTSLHGQPEVDEDLRELCAMKYYPKSYKYMDYITCRDKNIKATNWQKCATDSGMDAAKLKACAEGDEGKNLLSASIKASTKAKAQGSPTMYLNGALYSGGRTETDFTRALCNAMKVKPAACKNLPEPVKFDIIVLNDRRCTDCDTTQLEARLKEVFLGGVVKKLDYGNADGKKIYDDGKLTFLPAILLDKKVKNDPGYSQVSSYLEAAGDYLSLKIGSEWDPYCDATSDHCSEDRCKSRTSCRPEVPKKLEVFVMSQCPFGIQALNSIKEVFGAIKDMDFKVHYIADFDEATGKFNSLHGQPEVDEDLRQICAMKYYPDSHKYMDYVWCRNKDMKPAGWQKCATDNGMDAAKLKACAEGEEGKNLLKEDIKIANELNIGGSPTWLANNKYQFGGIAAGDISGNYCKYNQGLAGCEKQLSSDTGGVPAGGGCG